MVDLDSIKVMFAGKVHTFGQNSRSLEENIPFRLKVKPDIERG